LWLIMLEVDALKLVSDLKVLEVCVWAGGQGQQQGHKGMSCCSLLSTSITRVLKDKYS
jgi:hypothetical protein